MVFSAIFFKYGNFLLDNLSYLGSGVIAGKLGEGQIHLPIGISFLQNQRLIQSSITLSLIFL